MNILWIVNKYLDTSIDRVTWIETTKKLEQLGHRVLLLTGYKKERPSFGLNGSLKYTPSISVKILGFLTTNVSLFFYALYYLCTRKPGFVLLHPVNCLALLPFLLSGKLKLIKTKFVLDVRTLPVECAGIPGKVQEILFHLSILCSKYLCAGMTVITPFMKKIIAEEYSMRHQNIGVWTSGASLELFDPRRIDLAETNNLKEKMNLQHRFVIMYHGVLTPTRGLSETIQAIHLLAATCPDILLLLLGQGTAKAELENMRDHLNLQHHVVIKNPVPLAEVPAYIALADAGILPFPRLLCWRVSSPIKLMEYLAMEKPVIVTDIEAHRDVLCTNGCAVFIPTNSPGDIAQGILKLYQKKKHLQQIGKEGRQLIQDNYTWVSQAARLSNYLKSV